MIKRLIGEPLVHFLVGALLLFVWFQYFDGQQEVSGELILVDAARIKNLNDRWQATWRRPPTKQEQVSMIENYIREEVLYREGIRLGLDQGDAVVRNRMIQKMQFLHDGVAPEPSEDDLTQWLDENITKYQQGNRYWFEQYFFDQQVDSEQIQARLAQLQQGTDPNNLFRPLMNLPSRMQDASQAQIGQRFGDKFARQLKSLPINEWHAPVLSGFGLHAVRITQVESAPSPSLATAGIRQQVENDWRYAQTERSREKQYQQLRQHYRVRIQQP